MWVVGIPAQHADVVRVHHDHAPPWCWAHCIVAVLVLLLRGSIQGDGCVGAGVAGPGMDAQSVVELGSGEVVKAVVAQDVQDGHGEGAQRLEDGVEGGVGDVACIPVYGWWR